MGKYLELFRSAFDSSIDEKTKLENRPYVAYSTVTGDVVYTVVPKKEEPSLYEAVDLGLPSGLKWADRNVGAATPQDNGLYFDWGNVDGHAVDENGNVVDGYSFDENTYSATFGGQHVGQDLDAEHDAATVNMGGDWRMPTRDEMLELVENTDHYYIGEDSNIVAESALSSSKKLRSICFIKQGEAFDYNSRSNFIEFPFAGRCSDSMLDKKGLSGIVWSSSMYIGSAGRARNLSFTNSGSLNGNTGSNRYYGVSVRGVKP